MKLSTKTRYAVRAMIMLAQEYGKKPVMAHLIAKEQGLSKKYLEHLLTILKNAGLIITVRGKNGGYALAKEPDKINVFDIYLAFEGSAKIIDCLEDHSNCKRSTICPTLDLWNKISDSISSIMSGTSLKDLALKSKHISSNSMYYI